ncbi:uncharacterized protein LOC108321926 [Vigna angularis]|uniref:uncharacterized protein LOC108321926 n=1 Tax=Phaseolus angularis TaxID=3914 RepID=UPI00080A6937|nr:uncharacterized protein LOC108321926 [Vigna angularis]
MADVGRAIKARKLSPKLLGPYYEILRLIGLVAYETTHVLEVDDIQVREDLTIEVGHVRVLDVQTKNLRGKEIRTVKVLWDKESQEMTWELEEYMRKEYRIGRLIALNFRGRKFLE